MKNLIFSIK